MLLYGRQLDNDLRSAAVVLSARDCQRVPAASSLEQQRLVGVVCCRFDEPYYVISVAATTCVQATSSSNCTKLGKRHRVEIGRKALAIDVRTAALGSSTGTATLASVFVSQQVVSALGRGSSESTEHVLS
eukprot:scaffold221978_cov33-Tisochrysis_lutea.AAC.3